MVKKTVYYSIYYFIHCMKSLQILAQRYYPTSLISSHFKNVFYVPKIAFIEHDFSHHYSKTSRNYYRQLEQKYRIYTHAHVISQPNLETLYHKTLPLSCRHFHLGAAYSKALGYKYLFQQNKTIKICIPVKTLTKQKYNR